MKHLITRKIQIVALISVLSIFGLFTTSHAAKPAIFFSDMTDGPTSGWEGSTTKGAAVSIWGVNLGSVRGASTITVGGVTLNQDTDFAEWGAITNPTTARGLQRITFWLKSNMKVGTTTIVVSTDSGTSDPIPFTCRELGTSRIYFISRSGSDSNNGLVATSSGLISGPWFSAKKVRNLKAGDIAYFRNGIWNEIDSYGAVIDFWSNNHGNGTVGNSITIASYPGEVAQLGDSSVTTVLGHHGSTPDIITYWTISKFKMVSNTNNVNWGYNQRGRDDNLRFIGNDCTTTGPTGKTILPFNSGDGQTNLYLLGNYLHDAGVNKRGETAASKGYGFSFSGGTQFSPIGHDYIHVGWNESSYQSYGHAFYIYGHYNGDKIDHLYIHDNWFHHNSLRGAIIGGGDNNGGGAEYYFVKNAWFYNNILNDNGSEAMLIGGAVTHSMGDGGHYYIYNNTFYGNNRCLDVEAYTESLDYRNNICVSSTGYFVRDNAPLVSSGSNNLYYGSASATPSWDKAPITNKSPGFSTVSPVQLEDFAISLTSPLLTSGANLSTVFTKDIKGILRGQGAGWSIGAMEGMSQATKSKLMSPPTLK